jgi:hypothetical protein
VGKHEADASPKGAVGVGLLGAETVMLVEAVIDVKPAWAYIVGGAAGAVGGGVGGYFIDQMGDARLSVLLLAGGMALAIPTTVAVLSATAYEVPSDYVQDRAPADEPVAEPPVPESESTEPPPEPPPPARPEGRLERRGRVPRDASRPVRPKAGGRSRVSQLPPPALFGYDGRALTLGVPALELRDVYSRKDQLAYGLKNETEVRLPVLTVVF